MRMPTCGRSTGAAIIITGAITIIIAAIIIITTITGERNGIGRTGLESQPVRPSAFAPE